MKRNPRKLKWTKASRVKAGKEMVCDSTLLFGTRRNVPQRYDRDLVQKTVEAMKRIAEIRTRRERVFYKKRMVGNRALELSRARKLVAEHQHLLPRLRGSEIRRRNAEAAESGMQEITNEEALDELYARKTPAKVFGQEKRRIRVKTDGQDEEDGVGESMEIS